MTASQRLILPAIYAFLAQERPESEHAMVAYQLRNTVTENGHVARGGNVTSNANACKSHARECAPRPENGFDAIIVPFSGEDRRLVNIGFRLAADETK